MTCIPKNSSLWPEGDSLFERHPPHFSTAVYITAQPAAQFAQDGLTNMLQRATDMRGTCRWEASPDAGTQVSLKVPLPTTTHPA